MQGNFWLHMYLFQQPWWTFATPWILTCKWLNSSQKAQFVPENWFQTKTELFGFEFSVAILDFIYFGVNMGM